MLMFLFHCFNFLVCHHKAQHCKTIGDKFVAVSMPSEDPESSAKQIVELAWNMRECVRRVSSLQEKDWAVAVRVGLHTGSFIGAIVGKYRFSYDIYGYSNTVAMVMEQTCPVDGIQVAVL